MVYPINDMKAVSGGNDSVACRGKGIYVLRVACILGTVAILSMGATNCRVQSQITNRTCLACHDGRSAPNMTQFVNSPHAALSCERCHGPGDAHIRSGGRNGLFIFNPGALGAAFCAECHQAQTAGFAGSPHDEAGISCNDCHNVHRRLGMGARSGNNFFFDNTGHARLCGDCHDRQVDEFLLSGHAELGTITCSVCHSLHTAASLVASPLDNSLCIRCHGSFFLGFETEEEIDRHTGAFHPVDPAGTGSSRCVSCHMPPSRQANQETAPHDHTLFTIPPQRSNDQILLGLTPAPNSCAGTAGCHDANTPGSGAPFDVNRPADNDFLQPLYESIGEVEVGPNRRNL